MRLRVSLNNQSIESSGITSDYKEALCEYIWNGFEANATEVFVDYHTNELTGIEEIVISDNGEGIKYDEIEETFGTFLMSKKNLLSLRTKTKANKGKGRFSFTTFADSADWYTVYKKDDSYYGLVLSLTNEEKEIVECDGPFKAEQQSTETTVVLRNINGLVEKDMQFEELEPILLKEFAWFLYLHKEKGIALNIRGRKLDYNKYINKEFSREKKIFVDGHSFEVNLIVWEEQIKEKFCSYYFNSENVLKCKGSTTFNRNTVGFTHSVFVRSKFFDDVSVDVIKDSSDNQISLFETANDKKIMKRLQQEIQDIIEESLNSYIGNRAEAVVDEMIMDRKTFPSFGEDEYEQLRKKDLKKVTTEIIKIEPSIFYKLKPIQEKSLLAFLKLLLDSRERENVVNIIDEIVALTPQQREEFASILKKTKLEYVVDTIKFLEQRYRIIEILKTVVYDLEKFANERDHIQRIVENNFWLFGEQFNLATADQRMKTSLEKYINILYGEQDINAQLNEDLENARRMDIFLCNSHQIHTHIGAIEEENIVVELKAPSVSLTKVVLRQVEDYMDYVRRQPAFNSSFRKWKFIAVCKDVDDDIKSRYETFRDKGKPGLVHMVNNFEVYAYTWDDVFKIFELQHSSTLRRLNYDKDKLIEEIEEQTKDVEGRDRVNNLTAMATDRLTNAI